MRVPDYGEALRTGLLEASGEIAVIFDVDYYDLDFLKEALELLDASDVADRARDRRRLEAGAGCARRPQLAASVRDVRLQRDPPRTGSG